MYRSLADVGLGPCVDIGCSRLGDRPPNRGPSIVCSVSQGREIIMSNYVGLDVSQKTTMLCNVDGKGRRLRRGALPDCPFVTIEGPNPILTLP